MPKYNKLIRDLIPDIIRLTGKTPVIRTLTEEEYEAALKRKFREEVDEYIEADSDLDALKELADVLEVIHSLANLHYATFTEVDEIRERKLVERGGFSKRTFLSAVEE